MPKVKWNMDETNLSLEPSQYAWLHVNGVKNLPGRTANSRDHNTILACVNAAASWMPPMGIVKGTTERSLLQYTTEDAPQGTVWTFQRKAWMENVPFGVWFHDVFLRHCGPERPRVLFLDSHLSHETTGLLEAARANDIHVIALPPHTTHWTQPLDRSVFGPLQHYYDIACSEYMCASPSNIVTKRTWTRLFNCAWQQALSPSNIISGFISTGIHPLDRNAIPKRAYLPATERPIPAEDTSLPTPMETQSESQTSKVSSQSQASKVVFNLTEEQLSVLQSGGSINLRNVISEEPVEVPCASSTDACWDISVDSMFGVPSAAPSTTPKATSRQIKSHRLLTCDDVMNLKKEKEQKQKEKEQRQREKETGKATGKEKVKGKGKAKAASKKPVQRVDDSMCSICFVEYDKEGELDWVGCDRCAEWMHVDCIPITHDTSTIYTALPFYCHKH